MSYETNNNDNKKNEWSYFSQNKKDGFTNSINGNQYVKHPKGKLLYNIMVVLSALIAVVLVIDAIKVLAGGTFDVSNVFVPVFCAVVIIILGFRYIQRIRFINTYSKYFLVISDKVVINVAEIADKIGISEAAMQDNLKLAVHYKYIPQGRLSESKKLFIITNGEYQRYENDPEKYENSELSKAK